MLALEASNRPSGVRKLALYEPPLILDSSHPSTERHGARIGDALAAQDLAIAGSESAEWMKRGNRELSRSLPNAQSRLLKGQRHDVKPKALAPILAAFLEAR